MEPLTREQAFDLLERQPVAHLGIVLDGEPYVFPMSYVVDEERILFRTLAGKKLDGIRANPRVCVEVSSFDEETGNWQSTIVRGTARLVDSDEVRQTLIARLFTKYEKVMGSPLSAGGGLMPLGGNPYVIEVKVEEVTGMTSDGGFRIRTKPGRL
jgi:nitroimidazol reductase NimA-like FMN-containing flavoprotein (pyridoxamine 5'-phosphate oxidase superfamily)